MSTLKKELDTLQKKARERTVKTQTIEYDLETLVKKIRKGLIKIDPVYQRNHRWGNATSSKLIESLVLNIPIPLIYLSQDVDVDSDEEDGVARYSVIDGQQRLTAILKFMTGDLELEGLSTLNELNGMKFKDLPPFLVRRLEERTIRCLRIDSTVDSQVKFDIFERLNSGSVELNPQELRNAVHRGEFNELIKTLATEENFRILIGVDPLAPEESNKVSKMDDLELVLRFLALRADQYKDLNGKMKLFLDESMGALKKLDASKKSQMASDFRRVVRQIRDAFGDNAFAKYKVDEDSGDLGRASPFNTAVYDALMVAVSMEVDDGSYIESGKVDLFKELFRDQDFFNSVSGSSTDRSKVIGRIDAAREVFRQ